MHHYFVSHASADNPQIKPFLAAALEHGLKLWFDRPYDLPLPETAFAGYIEEGERWTTEILTALAGACGILYFPSAASKVSDECRLEIALGATFALYCPFKIVPIFLGAGSSQYLDARVTTVQGRRFPIETGAAGEFVLASGLEPQLTSFFGMLERHARDFQASERLPPILDRLMTARRQFDGAPGRQPQQVPPAARDLFGALADRYRTAPDWQTRRDLDGQITGSRRDYRLQDLPNPADLDEAAGMAAAMSIASTNADDDPDSLASVLTGLFHHPAARVRFRAADALQKRVQARRLPRERRPDVLGVLAAANALEKNPEVARAIRLAVDSIASTG